MNFRFSMVMLIVGSLSIFSVQCVKTVEERKINLRQQLDLLGGPIDIRHSGQTRQILNVSQIPLLQALKQEAIELNDRVSRDRATEFLGRIGVAPPPFEQA